MNWWLNKIKNSDETVDFKDYNPTIYGEQNKYYC